MIGVPPVSGDADPEIGRMPPVWRQTLSDVYQNQVGSPPEAGTIDRLLSYLALIARWNRVYNLTAVREPAQMLTQHLVDSLVVVGPLLREVGAAMSVRLLDVGSGAGLPGAVIALTCPAVEVTCVDAVAKKAGFIRQVAATLSCRNLHAVHARVEDLQEPPFDIVTSRAFSSLPDLVRLTRRHLAADGKWMAMKGKVPGAELQALPVDRVEVFHVEQLVVPELTAERCIVWMRPR